MGCNCKEKKPEASTTPCADETEESFRQAFLRETKKSTIFAAQAQELQKRLDYTEARAAKYIGALDRQVSFYVQWADGMRIAIQNRQPHEKLETIISEEPRPLVIE